MPYMNFCLMRRIIWAAHEQCIFPNTYIKFTVHRRPSCYGKKRRASMRVSAVETGQVAFVRANLWQPVCAIDGGMSVVVCACQLAREKETHRCRCFVPCRAFPTIRGTFQRDPERERGEGASEKPRIMIDILSNAGGKIRYLWVSMNQLSLFGRTI